MDVKSRLTLLVQCVLLLCIAPNLVVCQGAIQSQIEDDNELVSALLATSDPAGVATLLNEHKELLSENLWQRLIATSTYATSPEQVYEVALQVSNKLQNRRLTAITLYRSGWYQFGQGNVPLAIDKYLQSKRAFEEANSHRDLIYIFADLGTLSIYSSDFEQARKYSEQSLALTEQFKGKTIPLAEWPDEYGAGTALSNLGNIAKREGHYDQAIELFQKALTTFRGLDNGKNYFDSQIIDALADIGRTFLAKGDYIQSLANLNQAMTLAKASRNTTRVASIDNSIGILYTNQRDHTKAIEFFKEGLEIATTINDRFKQASLLLNLGVAYQFEKNYQQALEHFRKSLEIAKAINDKEVQILIGEGIGAIQKEEGKYAEAILTLDQSLLLARTLADRTRICELLWRKADVYYAKRDFNTTVSLASEAVSLADQLGQRNVYYLSSTLLGRAYRQLKQERLAEETFSRTIDRIEQMRGQVAGLATETQQFFEDKVDPYVELVDLLLARETPDISVALRYAEKAKARVLLDSINGERNDLSRMMTAQERQQANDLNSTIVDFNRQISNETNKRNSNETLVRKLKQDLNAARLRYEAFQDSINVAHVASNRPSTPTLNFEVTDVKKVAKDHETTFLEYVVLDSKTYLFVLTSGKNAPQLFTLDVNSKQLEQRVREFRVMLAKHDPGFSDVARNLYELLLRPAEVQLKLSNTVCIVPDGILWELPFQALQTEGHRYLIEDAAVYYAPSLSVLTEMSRRPSRTQTESLLAFGNPRIPGLVEEKLQNALRGDILAPLPEAETEVNALRGIWKPNKIFVGAKAEKRQFEVEASKYRIIHLATHGILDDMNPMYSRLVMSRNENDVKDDGLLEAREIMHLKLQADLVVLSACQTAQGRVGVGEGIVGMSWAFMVAGAPTVVASQWKVDSGSTARLMINFHRELKHQSSSGTSRKASALREAALHLMKEPRYRHPFFWAGFVMIGNGN